jgi:hypothetical protein
MLSLPGNSYDDVCSIDSDDTPRTEIADLAPPRVMELRLPSLSDLLLTGFCSPNKLHLSRGGEPAKDAAISSFEGSSCSATRSKDGTGQWVKPQSHSRETGHDSTFYAQFVRKPSKGSLLSLEINGEEHRTVNLALGESVAEPEDNNHDDELTSQGTVPFSVFSFRVLEVLVFTVLLYCATYKALQAFDNQVVFEFTPKSQHRELPAPQCKIMEPGFGDIDQVGQL